MASMTKKTLFTVFLISSIAIPAALLSALAIGTDNKPLLSRPEGPCVRIVLMPFGRIGFVEVKTPGEKPRSLQRLRIKTLRRLGFKAFVLDSPDQIGGIIDEIQTP